MAKSVQSQRESAFSSLFHDYQGPAFAVRLWDGWRWRSSSKEEPVCTVVVKSPRAFHSLIAEASEVTMGETFIRGGMDVEGDLFSVFSIAEHLFDCPRPLSQRIIEKASGLSLGWRQWLEKGPRHSQQRDRASIAYHYDLPLAFYEPWLGPSLAYSCAYFRSPEDSLDLAQQQKLDLICRKLRLKPRERFLDIGCGWGSLVLYAAGKYRVQAQGITLSREQARVTTGRIEQNSLESRCAVDLRDYRETDPGRNSFDKIASIGMFEHVGLKNLPLYFGTVRRLLKPGGAFLNHGITRAFSSPRRAASFIDRYVFPDGQLVTLSELLEAAESQGLEVRDVENLREHYVLTLRRWVEGLRENSAALLDLVSEATYRIWLLYMAGSAAAFRRGDIAVHQVLFSRPDGGNSRLPLTREDWYPVHFNPPEVHA